MKILIGSGCQSLLAAYGHRLFSIGKSAKRGKHDGPDSILCSACLRHMLLLLLFQTEEAKWVWVVSIYNNYCVKYFSRRLNSFLLTPKQSTLGR